LIGIESTESRAKYTIEVQRIDIFTTKQLKIGVPIKDQIEEEHQKQYMFVLDKKKTFRVSVSVYLGKVDFSLGKTKDFSRPVLTSEDGDLEVSEYDLKHFEEGENIYLRVRGNFDHSEYIVLVTHHDSFSIIPDSYTQEFSISPYDTDGIQLMYYPPSREHQLKIQINGYHDGVQFSLNTKKQFIYQIKADELQFPQNSEYDLKPDGHTWERDNRHSIQIIDMKPERDDDYVILMTIKPEVFQEEALSSKEKVKIAVNVNAHTMNILSPNIPYEENIAPELKNYKFYKFFATGQRELDLILTPCVCMTDMYVFANYDDAVAHRNVQQRTHHIINGEKKIVMRKPKGPVFVKVMLSQENEYSDYLQSTHYCAFQVVYIDKQHDNYKFSVDQYVASNEGRVDYDWLGYNKLHVSWGKIMKDTSLNSKEIETFADVYAIKARDVFANSLCGIKHATRRHEKIGTWNEITDNEITIDFNEQRDFKQVKYATFHVLASVNRNGAKVPYQALTIMVQQSWWSAIPWWIYFVVVIVVAMLGFFAFYFKTKAEDTQSKLDFEMNDIRNVARVGHSDDSLESENLSNQV
jgi:hypothetical protein